MPHPPEKRRKARKTFNEFISFQMIGVEANLLKNIHQKGLCLDISESGLGLTAGCNLKKGWVLKLFLPIKKVHTHLPVFAEVVRANRSNGHFRIGLRILQ